MADMSEPEMKLMEQLVYSEEEAYISYCNYAVAIGFDVRRGNQYYFKGTDVIRSKSYWCSNKSQTRTRCRAMISFLCDGSGKWNVSRFAKEHNHAMILPDGKPLVKYKQPIPHDDVHRISYITQPSVVATPCVASSSCPVAGSSSKRRRPGRPLKQKPTQDLLTYIPNEASVLPSVANCIHNKCKCKRFYLEPPGLCCARGKIGLRSHAMPLEMKRLLLGSDADSVNFCRNIRTYNNNFAFTSLGVKYDHELTKNLKGMYTFRVQGQFYHFLPPLERTGVPPSGIQMYYYDSNAEVIERCPSEGKLLPSVASLIQRILMENPYTRFFKRMYDDELPANCKIMLNGNPLLDQRTYNLPRGDQIAAIICETDDMSISRTPHIQVQTSSGSSQVVKQIYACCDPLQYPILFPYGEPGWHPRIEKADNETLSIYPITDAETSLADVNHGGGPNSVPNLESIPDAETLLQREDTVLTTIADHNEYITARQYYSYKLQMRDTDESILLHSLRLLQQYVVNVYVKIEIQRLDHIKFNQLEYRTELRAGVVDAVATGDSIGGMLVVRVYYQLPSLVVLVICENATLTPWLWSRSTGNPIYFSQ